MTEPLDPLLLRTAARAVSSAQVHSAAGRHAAACDDLRLAVDMLQRALLAEDYESLLRRISATETAELS